MLVMNLCGKNTKSSKTHQIDQDDEDLTQADFERISTAIYIL